MTQCLFNVCLIALNIKFCNFIHIAANVRIFFFTIKNILFCSNVTFSSVAHLSMVL